MNTPSLETNRLNLRAWRIDDAQRLAQIIGDWKIFDTTERIPHPYTLAMAEDFINKTHQTPQATAASFAIELKSQNLLIGGIALSINQINKRASLGYWLGVDYWGNGYTTESVRALLRFGFEELQLNRIEAQFLKRNPASGRVMEKAGMKLEIEFPKYAMKHGIFEDVAQYVLYASDFSASQES